MMRVIFFTIVLLVAPAFVQGQGREIVPNIALKDLHGRTVRLNAYRGRVLLVNFWATWCPPCRAEMPDLVRLQKEYARRGLQIVGIAQPPLKRSEVRRFTRRIKVNYPIMLGTKEISTLFEAGETLPVTFIVDRAGRVRDRIVGILEPEEFDEKVKPLLR
jgi:thiol-disulfide isomerase/thioredoxin